MESANKYLHSRRQKIHEILRFGITGAVSTIVTYGVYYLLLFWLNPTVSFSVAYLIAMVVNYLLTTSFTFKVKANKKNASGFVVSNIVNYVLCALFLNLFICLGVIEKYAPIPMYMVCIPINYLLVRSVMK